MQYVCMLIIRKDYADKSSSTNKRLQNTIELVWPLKITFFFANKKISSPKYHTYIYCISRLVKILKEDMAREVYL